MLKRHTPKRELPTIKNPNRICTICGSEYKAVAPLQKTCSKECRAKKDKKHQEVFHSNNPGIMKSYNQTRREKDPDVWKRKYRRDRIEIFNALGGKCCVEKCKTRNPLHFHFDYIPTMIGTGYRHPRHKAWVLEHLSDFRLICANHHYELTITGQIEGSPITQQRRPSKRHD